MHFHAIYKNSSTADGYVNATVIVSQIDVLNKGFAKTGLSFKLVNITVRLSRHVFLLHSN